MLVLSRRINDSIVLPDLNIVIEILSIKGNSVRIGVDAPVEIKVLRGELDSNQRERRRPIEVIRSDEHGSVVCPTR